MVRSCTSTSPYVKPYASALTGASDGTSFISIGYQQDLNCGAGAIPGTNGVSSDVVVALNDDDTRSVEWAKPFNNAALSALGADKNGGVWLAGNSYATTNLGGQNIVGSSIVLAHYDATGQHLFSKGWPADSLAVESMAVLPSGGPVLMGSFEEGMHFDTGTLTASDTSAFLAGFDKAGVEKWARKLDMPASTITMGLGAIQGHIAPLADGFAWVAPLLGTFDAGCGAVMAQATGGSVFVSQFTTDGKCTWMKSFGSAQAATPSSVASGPGTFFSVLGTFGGTADFGAEQPLVDPGGGNVFLAQFQPLTP